MFTVPKLSFSQVQHDVLRRGYGSFLVARDYGEEVGNARCCLHELYHCPDSNVFTEKQFVAHVDESSELPQTTRPVGLYRLDGKGGRGGVGHERSMSHKLALFDTAEVLFNPV